MNQPHRYIHPLPFGLPSYSGRLRALSRVPCALWIILIQFSSVAQLSPTLWDPMDHSTPGLPVHHQLPESTQAHVHWVGNDIQPSHPLSSSSPPALNLSQHRGLFKWVSSLHEVAKVLEFQLQTSVLPMNTQDWSPLGWTSYLFYIYFQYCICVNPNLPIALTPSSTLVSIYLFSTSVSLFLLCNI